jgi:periplasmic divalent cation tolerance protein
MIGGIFGISRPEREIFVTEGLVVLCTCPDEPTGERIARELVSSGLAACVNRLDRVRSTYRWKGTLQDEPEVLLVIKTVRDRYEALEMRLKALHPYEVPEIIAVPILAGAERYLAWMAAQTRPLPEASEDSL